MNSVIFRERLRPGVLPLVLGALAGVALGAVVFPFSATVAYVVGAVATVAVLTALVATSPVVSVELGDDESAEGPVLHAGRAHIGVEHLGSPEALDAGAMSAAMGREADVRAYLCHRPWVVQGVRVVVLDPRDPTPYWLVASRRPTELAAALGRAQAAHSEQTSWPPSS